MKTFVFKNCYKIILSMFFVITFFIGSAQGTAITLNPTDDTFIDEWAPTDNNGASTLLVVRRGGASFELTALLEFDLSSIPSGATITSAALKLYYYRWWDYNPAGRTFNVQRIIFSWDEATTTWNNRPGYDHTVISSGTVPGQTDNWMDFDLTSPVQDIIDGTVTNYGWRIIDPSTSSHAMTYFYAKENIDSIPRLEIEYELAEIDYWKPPHPNYAPSGMPDFDQKQDAWKTIYAGPNGIIDSPIEGDDVYGSLINVIASGPNCHLDTEPTGDDYAVWSYSGAAALANCFWWFDSKYADPSGYPGDGEDQFPLVEGYYGSGKVVDQQQIIYDMYVDIDQFPPGHLQSFTPSVSILDAVQIMLKFNYPGDSDPIVISIYDTYPNHPFIFPIGTSMRVITGPWSAQWYQFHFDPAIDLIPGNTYFIAVSNSDGAGNAHWCYEDYGSYPGGMAWECWDDYSLVPYPLRDFTFKTEYYVSEPLDDHSPENVPYLIEDLAQRICICTEGYSDINAMQIIIDEWLVEKGLDGMFEESTYTAPEFEFIEAEIERSQDVILLLGFYGEKLVDQQQTLWDYRIDLYPWPPGHLQEFTPTVSVLDAVQLLLQADTLTPTTVEVSIYDVLPNNPGITPLGTSIMVVSAPWDREWFQFHFEPPIDLTPGGLYYISARTLDIENNVEWCYITDDIYAGGVPWKNWDDYTLMSYPTEDFAFKTEYYDPDSCTRIGQHYVTCAGVNSYEYLIAFSDPYWDIRDGAMGNVQDHPVHPFDPTVHNDAQYVSHEIYPITLGSPCPMEPYQWWIPGYPAGYKYTIVEYAIVICPSEDTLGYEYLPGDVNMWNGVWPPSVIGSDVTYLVNYFRGVAACIPCGKPIFWASADINGDCLVIGSDVTRLVNYLRGIGTVSYCPAYPPMYPPTPPSAPTGWPNCGSGPPSE